MPSSAILGAQWGDEGKGKLVDVFASDADLAVRFQGGPNAGHTIYVKKGDVATKMVLHHIPSALLHGNIKALMTEGMVVDPEALLGEISKLADAGVAVTPERLEISFDTQIILPVHRALDHARESSKRGGSIGTTLRGMGPAYEDRAARRGIRFRDLADEAALEEKLGRLIFERNAALAAYGADQVDLSEHQNLLGRWREVLSPFLADTQATLAAALREDKRILYEGAQGTMLDLAFGTYPFVTSSSTIAGGICTGAGVPPSSVRRVVGVTKAYTTRVGKGPFPSELEDHAGRHLAEKGNEFGATTGRPRRCGWIDLVALKYAHELCGFTSLAMTKLDVLSGLKEVSLCKAYETPTGRIDRFPRDPSLLFGAKPVLETFPGWDEDLTGCRSLSELPAPARNFVEAVEEQLNIPIPVVSIGPHRDHIIFEGDPMWG